VLAFAVFWLLDWAWNFRIGNCEKLLGQFLSKISRNEHCFLNFDHTFDSIMSQKNFLCWKQANHDANVFNLMIILEMNLVCSDTVME
jgi:hypothetical protein